MKTLGLILLAFASLVISEDDVSPVDDGPLVLTKDNFDQVIKDTEHVMVEFFAPWCAHCQAMAPEYKKAAKTLLTQGFEIRLGTVDATEEQELAAKHGIEAYPTLNFFTNGKPIKYTGRRTSAAMVNWMKKQTGVHFSKPATVTEMETFTEQADVVVAGFFKDLESKSAKNYLEAATSIDEIFAVATGEDLHKFYKVEKDTVVVFKNFDERRSDLTDDITPETIKKHIDANSKPLVVPFNDETAELIFEGEIKSYIVLFIGKTSATYTDTSNEFLKAAAEFVGEVLFVFVDTDELNHYGVMDFFSVKKDEPTIRYINENNVKFSQDETKLDTESITKFVKDVLGGELKPFYKSEAIPKDWDAKPVNVLVGKNFEEVAFDKKKNVFVLFYAPWCKHCQNLLPVWDKLAIKYKSSEEIVVAKIDSTSNGVTNRVDMSGYPTLKLFPKNSNNILDCEGPDFSIERLSKFLDNEGTYANKKRDEL